MEPPQNKFFAPGVTIRINTVHIALPTTRILQNQTGLNIKTIVSNLTWPLFRTNKIP